MLVNILIIIFFLLIFYQILDCFNYKEGLENSAGTYQNYPEDPLILGRQNAGNIEVLKQEIVSIPDMKKDINDLKDHVKLLDEQIQGLNEQNAKAVQSFGSSADMLTSDSTSSEEPTTSNSSSSLGSFGGTSSGDKQKEGENSTTSYF
jgi:hypothetical protein